MIVAKIGDESLAVAGEFVDRIRTLLACIDWRPNPLRKTTRPLASKVALTIAMLGVVAGETRIVVAGTIVPGAAMASPLCRFGAAEADDASQHFSSGRGSCEPKLHPHGAAHAKAWRAGEHGCGPRDWTIR
mmetsp:Transcript_48684/g.136150  ORF Transcript_48684/g.136150 Transcript_48684/m.136150 type:complete len:131 (+) Transcript_48684:1588-1980(+)